MTVWKLQLLYPCNEGDYNIMPAISGIHADVILGTNLKAVAFLPEISLCNVHAFGCDMYREKQNKIVTKRSSLIIFFLTNTVFSVRGRNLNDIAIGF